MPQSTTGYSKSMRELAPLVRSKRVRKYKPERFIKGVQHQVASLMKDPITQRKQVGGDRLAGVPKGLRKLVDTIGLPKGKSVFDVAQRNLYQERVAEFEKTQRKRRKIAELPDPDANKLKFERREARRRMRGALGTMLTREV